MLYLTYSVFTEIPEVNMSELLDDMEIRGNTYAYRRQSERLRAVLRAYTDAQEISILRNGLNRILRQFSNDISGILDVDEIDIDLLHTDVLINHYSLDPLMLHDMSREIRTDDCEERRVLNYIHYVIENNFIDFLETCARLYRTHVL